MKAMGFSAPGGPEVLEILDLPDPTPGPGELRIRVHAAAVNPTDLMRRQGTGTSGSKAPPHLMCPEWTQPVCWWKSAPERTPNCL